MTPSVGGIVHVLSSNPTGDFPKYVCQAAMITAVPHVEEGDEPDSPMGIDLCVFGSGGLLFRTGVVESDNRDGWHWPERVV